ncbi:hypothetical protein [Ramlibacter sp. WS9]|uniref:hypothetical protein n=1 Tax=Ramlibacter sp. WS9 TaxID=1882741 RepID=UPI001144DAFF|nr:hypothetical protein [Ramlibacter sp. WS9]ROZ72717.1 hypothetical protein EEB15_18560 [Ramlibacter sp. WS9]
MRDSELKLPAKLLPRIGGMATMPSRLESLRIALPYIVAQVDTLYLYLDKYEEVPQELSAMPKVVALLPENPASSLATAGKFHGLSLQPGPCLYFCFDDDIIYGDGYVDHLAAALHRHDYRPVVGMHGAVYKVPIASYVKDRQLLHFSKALSFDVVVDELGTGTIAFHSSAIRIEPDGWLNPNMADLQLMIDAVRQKTQRICIRRPSGLLEPIAENQPDSLYRRCLVDDLAETQLLRAAMKHYPGSWCMSS